MLRVLYWCAATAVLDSVTHVCIYKFEITFFIALLFSGCTVKRMRAFFLLTVYTLYGVFWFTLFLLSHISWPSLNEIEKKETIAEKKNNFGLMNNKWRSTLTFLSPGWKKNLSKKNLGCVSWRKQSLVGKMSAERSAKPWQKMKCFERDIVANLWYSFTRCFLSRCP